MVDDTDLIVEKTLTGTADASREHRQSASMFLCWPGNMLDAAKDDERLPELIEALAKMFARWESRGRENANPPPTVGGMEE